MIGPDTYNVTEHMLSADLPQFWEVTCTGERADGSTFNYAWGISVTEEDLNPPELLGIDITFDARRTPRATAEISLPRRVITAAIRGDLDPERVVWVTVDPHYGHRRADGSMATLRLTDVTDSETAGTLTLLCASEELGFLEVADLPAPADTGASPIDPIDFINNMHMLAGYPYTPDNPENLIGAPLTMTGINDAWDAVSTALDANEWRYYGPARDGGSGTEIRPAVSGNALPSADLTIGTYGTITSRTARHGRTNAANTVNLIHTWRDTAGLEQRIIGTASTEGLSEEGNRRTLTIRRTGSITQANADRAASVLLTRARARAKSNDVQAISAFWLRPDMTILIPAPISRTPIRVLIDSITFSSDGLMSLTTRGIPDVWTVGDMSDLGLTIAEAFEQFPTIEEAATGPERTDI